MNILGIDEAGRGCVIGPMVLAAVLVTRRSWDQLLQSGVKDSKKLSPKRRTELAKVIRETVLGSEVEIIPPATIDEYCRRNGLNVLEAETAAKLIQLRDPDLVYIDAPGRGGERFKKQVELCLGERRICIIAENYADNNYVAVAAAGILAKVTRDLEIEKLKEKVGDFGSGYPSDPKTQNFLRKICQPNAPLPDYLRTSWLTVRRILEGEQAQLCFERLESKE